MASFTTYNDTNDFPQQHLTPAQQITEETAKLISSSANTAIAGCHVELQFSQSYYTRLQS
jgi:hypothetical protein